MSFLASRAASTPARRLLNVGSHFSSPSYSRTMSSVPKTMKGISISKNGGIEVLDYRTDIPVPEPKEGEVLVKNDFIGVNFIDTYFRSGLYKVPEFPYILGREGAGTVVSVNADSSTSSSIKPDARVAYMAPAAYAEYTVASTSSCYALPSGIDTKRAAAGLLQGLTAVTLIREAYPVKKGDWILIHAAAGGMGLWLCQLLKAVGAHTIGTASTEEKRELAKKAGAEVVLDYPETLGHENFVNKVKELSGGDGVACVFDGVGKATFDVSLDCVKRLGSMISFGNASGAPEPFTISRLGAKNVRLMRPVLFNYLATKEEFEYYTKDLFEMLQKENIDVRIHKTYDLKDAGQAQSDLEGRKTTGKLLLKP